MVDTEGEIMRSLFQTTTEKKQESATKLNFIPLSHGRIKRSGKRMAIERKGVLKNKEGYTWNIGRKES